MDNILESIAKNIPPWVKENKLYSKIRKHHTEKISENINDLYHEYLEKIKTLKNKHKDERLFIIATGPSLNKTNLELLKNETLMGMNTLYKNPISSHCNYFVVGDGNVWIKEFKNILKLNCTIFLPAIAGRKYLLSRKKYNEYIDSKQSVIPLKYLGKLTEEKKISEDISKGLYGYTTVVHLCLQIAYYLGFKKVYLVGCDCTYNKGTHFNNSNIDEKLKNFDWSREIEGFKLFKKFFEENNREIINATVGGDLEIFKRKKLEEII